MTREEKLQLNRDRQKAVRDAWAREKTYVEQGRGTVDWNKSQQKELLKSGRVKGYEGQHMKSCAMYPEYAASADNIQFLTREQHLDAHNSGKEKNGYKSPTNGYYNPKTCKMSSFGSSAPKAPKSQELTNPIQHNNRVSSTTSKCRSANNGQTKAVERGR